MRKLAKGKPQREPTIALINVVFLMLVFFMVTSTYLNLDMIPVAETAEEAAEARQSDTAGAPLLIRLGADGQAYVRGQPQTRAALTSLIAARPEAPVTILPAMRADTQALVTLMDTATAAGAGRLRILQVAAP